MCCVCIFVRSASIREEDTDLSAASTDDAHLSNASTGRSTLIELVVDLHRAKIRDLLAVLSARGIQTKTINSDGSLETRKTQMLARQNHVYIVWIAVLHTPELFWLIVCF